MGADAAGSSSLSVAELHRQLAELGEELRSRKEAEGFALQRENAFAEILSVINDPCTDVTRVFSVMIESATKLCSAAYGYVWLYDGERARPAASYAQQPFGDWLRQRESVPNKSAFWARHFFTIVWFTSSMPLSTRGTGSMLASAN